MSKILLLLLCALMLLLEPAAALASPAETATTEMASSVAMRIGHRPNYKKYRGNSRHKAKKLGVFRRWKLYRKAKRKRAAQGHPSIKVGKPVRTSK